MYDVAVIGAGPAGLVAAISAARNGASVVLLDGNSSPGRKLLLTGGGRCNITRAGVSAADFGEKARFILPSLKGFGSADAVRFLEENGLPTVNEDGRIFPASGCSRDVLDTLVNVLGKSGVELLCGLHVVSLCQEDGRIVCVECAGGKHVHARCFIVATGGACYPQTGSRGDGYDWARQVGHAVVKPLPALTPVFSQETWIPGLEGLSLDDAAVSLCDASGKRLAGTRGALLFTSAGLSGPAILDIGGSVSAALENGAAFVHIDLFPDMLWEDVDVLLREKFASGVSRKVKNVVAGLAPDRLLGAIFGVAGVDGDKLAGVVTRDERRRLAGVLKRLVVGVSSTGDMATAMATAGGVSLADVDRKTMRSRIVDNLFFAGEILDLDGPTGGYNLQICWSTGWLAGERAALLSRQPL